MAEAVSADSETKAGQIPGLTEDESRRYLAAATIQKNYRGFRQRRQLQGFGLSADTRWTEVLKDAQYAAVTRPQAPKVRTSEGKDGTGFLEGTKSPKSPALTAWKRATKIAERAGQEDFSDNGDTESGSEDEDDEGHTEGVKKKAGLKISTKTAKVMDMAYWLELVDGKHRHGSNLRKYHVHWQQSDTKQNFFYWLDEGEGKELDLEECSRERLNKMQVRYLSREERLNYLVKVDGEGMLCWAKNGERVWTKDELYKDSIKGIVPVTNVTPKFRYNVKLDETSGSTSEDTEDEETVQPDKGERYMDEDFHRAKGPAKLKYVNAGVVFNHMMRTSLKKGHKWIFVCDRSFRMYIGYKQAGAFQHSSFIHGSRVLAAGQIKVKRGQLRKLSPLSGHYKCKTANFRAFVESLKENGVDMSHLSISQSYAVLLGLEVYTKTRGKVKDSEKAVVRQKDKILNPEKVKAEEETKRDKSKSAEKEREVLERERLERRKSREVERAERSFSGKVSKLFKRMSMKGEEEGGLDKLQEGQDQYGPEAASTNSESPAR